MLKKLALVALAVAAYRVAKEEARFYFANRTFES